MKKLVLDLFEILRPEFNEENSLLLIGKYLVIKKLDSIKGTTNFKNMITSSEPYNLGHKCFKKINLEYNILPIDVNELIDSVSSKIVIEKLLLKLDMITLDKLAEIYDIAIAQTKVIDEKTLPNSIEKVAMSILSVQDSDSLYVGASGMGMCTSEIIEQKVKNDLFYRCELDKITWMIWRLREFLYYSKSFAININPLLEPIIEENSVQQFDIVFINPPFGMSWKEIEREITEDKYGQYTYGLQNARSSELLFASHVLSAIKPSGRGIIVVPSGSLFCTGKDQRVREKMLTEDVIEAVVSLPAGLYKNIGIPVNLLIFNKNKPDEMKNKILFINAENMGVQNRRNCSLDDIAIEKIVDAYYNKLTQDQFCCVINVNEIKEANLLPSRYVYKRKIKVDGVGFVFFDWMTFPEGKEYASLDKFVDIYRGINITKDIQEDENGEYQIINLADVQDGELAFDRLKRYTISNNAKVSAYEVQENDIIITARGELTKICCIPDIGKKVLLSQNFYGMRLKNNYYSPKIIKMYLESPVGQYMLAKKKSGTAIPLLSVNDLKTILLPDIEDKKQREAIFYMEMKMKELEERRKQLAWEEKEMKLDAWRRMGIDGFFKIIEEK